MMKGIGLSAALGFAILCAEIAVAQSVPDAPGKQEFLNTCTICHSLDRILDERRSREGWTELVNTMRVYGAQASQKDFDIIVDYLSNTLGLDSKPAPSAGSASRPEPSPDPRTPGS
jgi:competence protein ComEA